MKSTTSGQFRKPPPVCPLCLKVRERLTVEDALPTWVRGRYIESHVGEGQLPPKVKIRICRECNGHLASVFENRAAAIIKQLMVGGPVDLDRRQQKILASWMLKTDLMLELARHDGWKTGRWAEDGLLPPREAYRRMITKMMGNRGQPPHNSTVRIGMLHPFRESLDQSFLPENWPPHAGIDLHSIHQMMLLVTETAIGFDGTNMEEFSVDVRSDERLVQIWPVERDVVTWPPASTVTPSDVEALRSEWGHAPHNRIGGGFRTLVRRRRWLPAPAASAGQA